MRESRVPGDHPQIWKSGQLGDNVFGNSVSQEVLLGSTRHVGEWQDRDGRQLRRFRTNPVVSRFTKLRDTKNVHGSRDVLYFNIA